MHVRSKFPKTVRLIAEISSIKELKGSYYIELVEYDQTSPDSENKVKLAVAQGVIFPGNSRIVADFKKATGQDLSEKLIIDFVAEINFTKKRKDHLYLSIIYIDPTRTLGAMHFNLLNIKNSLSESGVIQNNKRLPHPFDFLKIALLAPVNSDALTDFQKNMAHNFNTRCKVDVFGVPFSGTDLIPRFLGALEKIESDKDAYDAVVIIRGGGSKSDIENLNRLEIAAAICRLPIPVFTGIGHENDKTVLDEIANMSHSTPTAVAKYISRQIDSNIEEIKESWASIQRVSLTMITQKKDHVRSLKDSIDVRGANLVLGEKNLINQVYSSCKADALAQLDYHKELTSNSSKSITRYAERMLSQEHSAVSGLYAQVHRASGSKIVVLSTAARENWNHIRTTSTTVVSKRGYEAKHLWQVAILNQAKVCVATNRATINNAFVSIKSDGLLHLRKHRVLLDGVQNQVSAYRSDQLSAIEARKSRRKELILFAVIVIILIIFAATLYILKA
jgi:exodeoxyribonuclease VII large subunit